MQLLTLKKLSAALLTAGTLLGLLTYIAYSKTEILQSHSVSAVDGEALKSYIREDNSKTLRSVDSTKVNNQQSQVSSGKSLQDTLQKLADDVSNLKDTLHTRDQSFSIKLDEIRNIAMDNLEGKDTLNSLAVNITQLAQTVYMQDRSLAQKIDELRNIDLETFNKMDSFGPNANTEAVAVSKDINVLDRPLLILAGDIHIIMTKTHIDEFADTSMTHRDLFFGGRGRDKSIKTENLFDNCAPGCEFSTDPARFNESDVVIFYAGSTAYRALKQSVVRAFPEQRFVFHYFEQPHNFEPSDLDIINSKVGINWTVHYQQDATVYWPYGRARVRPTPFNLRPEYSSWKKRKLIWVVSRCSTLFAHREQYVAELMKYIDIDVYGKCIEGTARRVPMDVNKIAGDYKFFISFENGDCDDYITEKFFRYAKEVMIVPIVLGRRNHYEQLAPEFSYIQADQFDSPQQLAAYLHVLDKDNTLYHKYFQWRRTYTMDYMPRPVCEMCQIFRNKWFEPSQIDMHKYHGYQRCWKANRGVLPDWITKATNYTYTDPWSTIKSLNSRDKPLRFS